MGRSIGLNEPVLVSWNGRARWLTPTILDGFCKQFVRYFPFDDQYCPLKFYSWNYDVGKLMLIGNDKNMLSNYTGMKQLWKIRWYIRLARLCLELN